jgi:ATP-dependent Clp protease ATP-binding subunit ClpA
MAFAGPSGHGKTETAKLMGALLSVNHKVIDCAQLDDRMDLLGASNGYHRSEEGSEFNNFVGDNHGKRAVVVLDEFDKTKDVVRKALLTVIQDGEFNDRRTNRKIDCKNFIWILATNHGDDMIRSFFERYIRALRDDERENVSLEPLQDALRNAFMTKFGAPLTGRTHILVPFLCFFHSEAAVVLHKFVLEVQDQVRKPIDLREDVKRYIGHFNLNLIEDGEFCMKLAEQHYHHELGARSLLGVRDLMQDRLTKEYTNTDELVSEDINNGPLKRFTVALVAGDNGQNHVNVYEDQADDDDNDH